MKLLAAMIFGSIVSLGVAIDLPQSYAADIDHAARANQLREASKARAQSSLQRETIANPNEGFDRQTDYYALGVMMKRLGALIQALGEDPAKPVGGLGTGLAAGAVPAYGPDGPTLKSVRLILEYRLMIVGNPRLKVGDVRDAGKEIYAQVVTAGNAIVEEYVINKESGIWRPNRENKGKK